MMFRTVTFRHLTIRFSEKSSVSSFANKIRYEVRSTIPISYYFIVPKL